MAGTVTFTLETCDVFQLLDALSVRAEAWEKTADVLNDTFEPDEDELLFMPEECHRAEEAEEIAKHFRDIIVKIEHQMA